MAHAETDSFRDNKNPERQRGHEHVNTKETANAIGKQIVNKKRRVEPVLRQPRNELPVRQQKSKNSQGEVNALHRINSFAP